MEVPGPSCCFVASSEFPSRRHDICAFGGITFSVIQELAIALGRSFRGVLVELDLGNNNNHRVVSNLLKEVLSSAADSVSSSSLPMTPSNTTPSCPFCPTTITDTRPTTAATNTDRGLRSCPPPPPPAAAAAAACGGVSFGSVEVRQYERVVGGGGHLGTLASLGLGWRYFSSETYDLSSSSSSVCPPPPPRSQPYPKSPPPPSSSQKRNNNPHSSGVPSCPHHHYHHHHHRDSIDPEQQPLSSSEEQVGAEREVLWLAQGDARVDRLIDYGFSIQEIFKAEQIFQDMAEEEQEKMFLRIQQQQQQKNKKKKKKDHEDDTAATDDCTSSTMTNGSGKWDVHGKATRGFLKRIRKIRDRLVAKRCSAATNAA